MRGINALTPSNVQLLSLSADWICLARRLLDSSGRYGSQARILHSTIVSHSGPSESLQLESVRLESSSRPPDLTLPQLESVTDSRPSPALHHREVSGPSIRATLRLSPESLMSPVVIISCLTSPEPITLAPRYELSSCLHLSISDERILNRLSLIIYGIICGFIYRRGMIGIA